MTISADSISRDSRTYPVYVINVDDSRTGRIRVRCVGDYSPQTAVAAAKTVSGRYIRAAHGGDVNNSYGYPAETEAGVWVAIRRDDAIYVCSWYAQLPANKVTVSGASEAACGYRVFDGRCSADTLRSRREALYAEAAAAIDSFLACSTEIERRQAHLGYVCCHGGEAAWGTFPESAMAVCVQPYAAALAR